MSLPVTPATGGNAASSIAATTAQAAMELRLLARRGENLFVTVVLPVILLAFFSVVPAVGQGGVTFLLPGILALAIISTSLVNLGISTAFERSYGVLKRLGGSPLPRSGLIAAKIATVVIVEIGQVVLLVAIAASAFGWRLGPDADAVVCLAAFALGTLAFAGLGLLLAGTLRAEADTGNRQRAVPGPAPRRRGHPPGRPPAGPARGSRPGPARRGAFGRAADRPWSHRRRPAATPRPPLGLGRRDHRPRVADVPLGVTGAGISCPCALRPVASRPRAGPPRRGAP